MMEHVRQFDWCASLPDRYFVEETDIDNCNTEKILRNKFFNPLLSSDEDEDDTPNNINWDEIFQVKKNYKNKLFVPCLRPAPPYPKLSVLNNSQHNLILKVLSAENPDVLPGLHMQRPSKKDLNNIEKLKESYLKEQKEYIEWAKTMWTTDHCIRALRPKPAVETVYEAEFKVKAQRMRGLPKVYDVAAQITLQSGIACDAILKEELINVNLSDMPQIHLPGTIDKQFCILRPCTLPEPCQKHPYQIVLPNENTVSMLPTSEIYRELAMYALTNGAQYIASENALKCLMQQDRHWMLPLSVCETIGPDGDKVNVVVLDSEFSVNKESAPIRTWKAFRHLLEHAVIPSSEREKVWQRGNRKDVGESNKGKASGVSEDVEMTSDDEDLNLFIDTGDLEMDTDAPERKSMPEEKVVIPLNYEDDAVSYFTRAVSRRISEEVQDIGVYCCTCKGTQYEKPPRRSFKKWQFVNNNTDVRYNIIIHCPHKAKCQKGEVLLEPIPEYQVDMGASKLTDDHIRSVALSLMLRKNASLLNVRVDGPTGDVVTYSTMTAGQLLQEHGELCRSVPGAVLSALQQLQGLMPGHYVLQHESSHGANALLLSPRSRVFRPRLQLQFDCNTLVDTDEAKLAKHPPTLTTDLLPYHKYRRTLPCAFTPYEGQLVKEPVKKPAPKKRAPPRAIKWPVRKSQRKKR